MDNCDNKACFNHDQSNPLMCDDCLEAMFDSMTIDEMYELYNLTNEMLADGGLLSVLIGNIEEGGLQQYRENLFNIFNRIMRTKIHDSDEVI